MKEEILQRAILGVRRNGNKVVKPLGHTNNGVRMLGQTYNNSCKMSHSKAKL